MYLNLGEQVDWTGSSRRKGEDWQGSVMKKLENNRYETRWARSNALCRRHGIGVGAKNCCVITSHDWIFLRGCDTKERSR